MEKKFEIVNRIKQRREELNMTQEELGNALWLNKSTIHRYETGKVSNIKMPIIQAIAKQLDVDPNWLLINSNEAKKRGDNMLTIKTLRIKAGLTRADVAKILNVSKSAVAMWELGQRQPNAKKLKQLAKLFDITVDQLLESIEI